MLRAAAGLTAYHATLYIVDSLNAVLQQIHVVHGVGHIIDRQIIILGGIERY